MSNINPRAALARRILEKGKVITPDRFPQVISDEVAEEWGESLAATFAAFPVEIWPEAVRVYAMEIAGDRMATPGELRAAARIVRDRWETVPERRELLSRRREERRERQDMILDSAARRASLNPPPPRERPALPAEVEAVDWSYYVGKLRRRD